MPCEASRTPDIALEIVPKSNYLILLRNLLNCLAQQLQLSESDTGLLEMCLDEACANSIDSMNKHGILQPVRVEVELKDNCVCFSVCDNGHDYSHQFHKAQPMDNMADRTKRRGYGLRIIKTLMDEVDYSHDPQRGNRLYLVKYLSQG